MKKKILRALVLSCVLCLMSIVSKAQWVSIPDSNFAKYLNGAGFSQSAIRHPKFPARGLPGFGYFFGWKKSGEEVVDRIIAFSQFFIHHIY